MSSFLQIIAFLAAFFAANWLILTIGRARRITVFGRAVGFLAVFLAIRYFAIPIWLPETRVGLVVKGILTLLFLDCPSRVLWRPGVIGNIHDKATGELASTTDRPRGLVSTLFFRLTLALGIVLCMYDVVAMWPVFGQAWFFVYLVAQFLVGGLLSWLVFAALAILLNGFLNDKSRLRVLTSMGFAFSASVAAIVFSIATLVFFVHCLCSATYRERIDSRVESIVEPMKARVMEKMSPLLSEMDEVVAVWNKIVDKDKAYLAGKSIQASSVRSRRSVRNHLARMRSLLLPVDSKDLFAELETRNRILAKAESRLEAARESRSFHPERAEKLDAVVANLEQEVERLLAERKAASDRLFSRLSEIGLGDASGSVSNCVLTINAGDLIDNAIVAKNIGLVVDELRAAVKADDVATAKRYYGAYVVMLDVQAECYRQYLDKSKTGIWTNGLKALARDASLAKQRNEELAASGRYPEAESAAFRHNAELNARTIRAAELYQEVLKKHEGMVAAKLAEADRLHNVALSSLEAVSIAGGLVAKIDADQTEFKALLELNLPTLALFDDAGMRDEINSLTEQLMNGGETPSRNANPGDDQ